MFDTISYIPTILAYSFMGLLFVILCFIVIYIGYNIAATVYANFPAPTAHILERRTSGDNDSLSDTTISGRRPSPAMVKPHMDSDNPFMTRKSKTALRIIVAVEPSYLAYVIFAFVVAGEITHESARATLPDSLHYNKVVKFFDRLSDIPTGRIMDPCPPPDGKAIPQHDFRPSETFSTTPTRQTRFIMENLSTRVTFNHLLDGVVQSARKSDIRPVRRATRAPRHLTYTERESELGDGDGDGDEDDERRRTNSN